MNEEGLDCYTTPTVIPTSQSVALKKGTSIESDRYHMHYETTTTVRQNSALEKLHQLFYFPSFSL